MENQIVIKKGNRKRGPNYGHHSGPKGDARKLITSKNKARREAKRLKIAKSEATAVRKMNRIAKNEAKGIPRLRKVNKVTPQVDNPVVA